MSDLISRQDAMTLPVLPKEYRQYQTTNLDDAYDLGWDDCQMHLNSLPSVQQEPKTGMWTIEDVHSATYKYCCSECKAHHRARYDFCPTCGAKMLEEGGEDE